MIMNAIPIWKFYTLAADVDCVVYRYNKVVKQGGNPRMEIQLNYKRRNDQF